MRECVCRLASAAAADTGSTTNLINKPVSLRALRRTRARMGFGRD